MMKLEPIHYNEFLNKVFDCLLNGKELPAFFVTAAAPGPNPIYPIVDIDFVASEIMVDDGGVESFGISNFFNSLNEVEFLERVEED